MSAFILIILQLACSSLSLSIIEPPNPISLFTDAMSKARHDKEVERLRQENTGLGMYDDNGEFFPITTQENPSEVHNGRIKFRLFTKNNPINGQELTINDTETLETSNFVPAQRTVLITHGWMNSENSDSCLLIRNAYVNETDYNVIVVDWSVYSVTINYIDAAEKTLLVGHVVAEMIKFLWHHGLRENRTKLVGHSLGAHVMGIAGYRLKPRQVQDIIGLDPALPMFNFADEGESLSKEDASRVIIIHTNGGFLGYICPRGHVDFFPNGGIAQAGCCKDPTKLVSCASCSHERAYEYFAESLTRRFDATLCSDYASFSSGRCSADATIAPMGGLVLGESHVPNGTYYLTTGENEPYSENPVTPSRSSNLGPLVADKFCDVAVHVT